MLEFWFNPNSALSQKILIIAIATITAIGLHLYAPMPSALALLFIAAGIVFLICRFCKIHIIKNNPQLLLYRVFTWIPLAFLCAILFVKALEQLLPWGIQGLAITVLTICLLSPQVLFKKSH